MNYFRLRPFLVVFMLWLLPGLVEQTKAQTEFGFTGGLNISSHINAFKYQKGDIQLNLDPKIATGYQGGLILRQHLSKAFRMQIEPSVILLGARYDESFNLRGAEIQTESRTELLYIQLPLLFQLSTVPPQRVVYGRETAKTTYHLSGGVFGGYLLDAKFSGTNSGAPLGISFEGAFSNDVSDQYPMYNGGVLFGLGLEYGADVKVGFETRAQYTMIHSDEAPEFSFDPQNIALTFALYFIL